MIKYITDETDRVDQFPKSFLYFSITLAFLFCCQGADAAGYTAMSNIQSINVRENGVEVYMAQAGNPMNCSNTGWFRISPNAANYNTISAFIFTQYAQRAMMRMYAYNCDTDGTTLVATAGAF